MAKIFSELLPDDIVEGNATIVTTGLWSGDTGSLSSFFTSSAQTSTDNYDYYLNVYQANPAVTDTAEVQFSVAYGHISGGGAPTLTDSDTATLSTKATYNQYKNILLGQEEGKFTFNGVPSDHIYVINIQRARLKERLDPGNWMLTLATGSSSEKFRFIDDSEETLEDSTTYSVAGRAFNVVSGSISAGIVSASASSGKGFGLVYPDRGIIILNPDAICPTINFSGSAGAGSTTTENPATAVNGEVAFAPYTGSLTGGELAAHQRNHLSIYYAIKNGGDFQARSSETISSTHFFVRLKNKEFNFSNNPTLKNPVDGTIQVKEFIKKPKTYVTTVGLYNSANELLAIGKLSRPIEKSEDKEALLRIRLDF